MLRAYFVSDIHLKSMNEPNAQALVAFLRAIAPGESAISASHVFLLGDIFDLWIGSHRRFVDAYRPVVDAVRALSRAGVEVHAFEGNHDLYLGEFWQGTVGARVHRDSALFLLGDLRVRAEHGDLINLKDRGYLALRRALRAKPIEWLATRLPDRVVRAIGERASDASRSYTSSARKRVDPDGIRAMTREHAARALAEEEFDLIVSGHVHVEDDAMVEAGGRRARSVNLGWWRESRRAFVVEAGRQEFVSIDSIIG